MFLAFWYPVIAVLLCIACVFYPNYVGKLVAKVGPKSLRLFLDATGSHPTRIFGLLLGISGVIVYIILYSRIR